VSWERLNLLTPEKCPKAAEVARGRSFCSACRWDNPGGNVAEHRLRIRLGRFTSGAATSSLQFCVEPHQTLRFTDVVRR